MPAVEKCSLPKRENLMQPIHMQLSKNLKTIAAFFSASSKCSLNFEYFQKTMALIAYTFLRLRPG